MNSFPRRPVAPRQAGSLLRIFPALTILLSLFSLLLTGCADDHSTNRLPAMPIPVTEPIDDPAVSGPFAVGHLRTEFIDELRDNRVLPADIWYPAEVADTIDAQPAIYPLQAGAGIESEAAFDDVPIAAQERRGLLVFSHGFGGTNTQSTPLMEHLASHGFVVVSPEHTGNTSNDSSDSGGVAAARRVPDISFIIDSLLDLNDIDGELFSGAIDAQKIGVLGHSFGGFTSIGMAAGFGDAPADQRVKAIMPVSAAIRGAYTADDLARIDVPVLLMGGTLDTSVPIEQNDFAFDALNNAPRVMQVDIIGATHTHFANICGIANWLIENGLDQDSWPLIGAAALIEPYRVTCAEEAFPLKKAVLIQNLYAAAFFRFYLEQESGYEPFFSTDYAQESQPDINFKVREAQ